MTGTEIVPSEPDDIEGRLRSELAATYEAKSRGRFKKLLLAAMGSIPWVGGLIIGVGALKDEVKSQRIGDLQREWLEEHSARFVKLGETLGGIMQRLEEFGEETQQRIESPEYLALVRKAFRTWDKADTDEKRDYVRRLLGNAGSSKLVEDDLVRLFIDWLDRYHEAHFQVVRVVYQYPGVTRAEIWDAIHGTDVAENSAEADLFKLLVRELSMGSVIRQQRATDAVGRFLKKPPSRRPKGQASPYMKSAFDDKERYELTQLGEKFVHYTMDDIVPRVGG
jgi:hypothetical protein